MDFVGSGLDTKRDMSVLILNKKTNQPIDLRQIDTESVFDDTLRNLILKTIERRNQRVEDVLRMSLDDCVFRRGVLEVEYSYSTEDGYYSGSHIWLSRSVPQGELHTHKTDFGTTAKEAAAKWFELNQKDDNAH